MRVWRSNSITMGWCAAVAPICNFQLNSHRLFCIVDCVHFLLIFPSVDSLFDLFLTRRSCVSCHTWLSRPTTLFFVFCPPSLLVSLCVGSSRWGTRAAGVRRRCRYSSVACYRCCRYGVVHHRAAVDDRSHDAAPCTTHGSCRLRGSAHGLHDQLVLNLA